MVSAVHRQRADLAREATDRCLARTLVGITSLEHAELADLLLDARPLAIAMADAAVALRRHQEDDPARLLAVAESAATAVFRTAIRAREAEMGTRAAEAG